MPEMRASPTRPQTVSVDLQLPASPPRLPDSIARRFGTDIAEYDEAMRTFWTRTRRILSDAHFEMAVPVNVAKEDSKNIRKEFTAADATLTASFTEAIEVVVDSVGSLVTRTTTLESQVQTPTTGLLARVQVVETTYATQTFAEAKKSEAITASNGFTTAAVLVESSARATADGHLSGKLTLSAIAGNIVTGINITSASGPGTTISDIIFHAANLKVYSPVLTTRPLLNASADGFIFGADLMSDNYVLATTGWKLTRDTGILIANDVVIRGAIYSTVGTIGGWTLGSTFLAAGSGTSAIAAHADGSVGFIVGNYTSGLSFAQLNYNSGAPTLTMFNSTSAAAVSLYAAAGGGQLVLREAAGLDRITLNGSNGNGTFEGTVTANEFNATP